MAKPADPTTPSMPSMILALISTKGSNQSPPCGSSACAATGVSKAAHGPNGCNGPGVRKFLCAFFAPCCIDGEAGGTKRSGNMEWKAHAVGTTSQMRVAHHVLRVWLARAIRRKSTLAQLECWKWKLRDPKTVEISNWQVWRVKGCQCPGTRGAFQFAFASPSPWEPCCFQFLAPKTRHLRNQLLVLSSVVKFEELDFYHAVLHSLLSSNCAPCFPSMKSTLKIPKPPFQRRTLFHWLERNAVSALIPQVLWKTRGKKQLALSSSGGGSASARLSSKPPSKSKSNWASTLATASRISAWRMKLTMVMAAMQYKDARLVASTCCLEKSCRKQWLFSGVVA